MEDNKKRFLADMTSEHRALLGAGTLAAVTAVTIQPANAGMTEAVEQINTTMTMLSGIAETGVGIVIVPFGISFALKIAGHVLRAGT